MQKQKKKKKIQVSSRKGLFIFVKFKNIYIFLDIFPKTPHILHFMKIRAVGADFFHADGQRVRETDRQTDTKKLIVAFRKFREYA